MIKVYTNSSYSGYLFKDHEQYFFEYSPESLHQISLVMPPTKRIYLRKHYLHPFFEMYLPEGYLYELFKQLLTKEYGKIDDYLLFEYLAPNISGRVTFKTESNVLPCDTCPSLDELIMYDSEDSFIQLLKRFMNKNAVAGVQPKTIAIVTDKVQLDSREYIIKTWGQEFPYLAENEYFSMQALQKAGVVIPNLYLSANRRFLIVEKFTNETQGHAYGFEEVLGIIGKNRIHKYDGSYEQVAKVIFQATSNDNFSMIQLYKMIVLNFILKNGDAHLRNFGVLYEPDMTKIRVSPAYDVVTTVVYMYKDKPALTLFGRKVWAGLDELKKFGQKFLFLSEKECKMIIEECRASVKDTITEIKEYIFKNKSFAQMGKRMIDVWEFSLTQTETIKEMPGDIIRNWE
ncbi:MAG: type II toxin-antitoxin system HipA family toxin [Spirochaetota bacterium]